MCRIGLSDATCHACTEASTDCDPPCGQRERMLCQVYLHCLERLRAGQLPLGQGMRRVSVQTRGIAAFSCRRQLRRR